MASVEWRRSLWVGFTYVGSVVQRTVLSPASGEDRYRILSLPMFNGAVLRTELAIEFEAFEQ